jgi:hypothetical protein
VIELGLALAIASAVAINGGYALQHRIAARLPPLTIRRPVESLLLLLHNKTWLAGMGAGAGGWVFYVTALALAPLSLVQACAAGGIGVLAVGAGRLSRAEQLGVFGAFSGLLLLALSLGSHSRSERGDWRLIALWMALSAGAAGFAALVVRGGPGLGIAAGILYAAGDVGTKAAVEGGGRLVFVPFLLLCHGVAFAALQLAFQRGSRLSTAGLAVLWTNALPIAAGPILFEETIPGGFRGAARVAAFLLVLIGAVALSRQAEPALETAPAPAP